MSAWTEHRIFALRTFCNEATPGPWEVYPDYAPGMRVAAPNPDCPDEPFDIVVGPTNHHDWVENDAFIAAARTALPEALDAIERVARLLDWHYHHSGDDNISSTDVHCALFGERPLYERNMTDGLRAALEGPQ